MSVAHFIVAAAAAAADVPDDRAVRAMYEFGSCVVDRARSGVVEQLLALDYRTDEYRNRLQAVMKGHDRCLAPGWQLSASRVLIAGALAEAVLRSEVKADEVPGRLAYDPARRPIKARSPTEAMALCTALVAPQATARLLSTKPTSKQEREAMQAIGPAMASCLRKDAKLALNKPALRSLLALAAWRIVTTPKVPS